MDNKIKALEDVITDYQISDEELQLWYEKRRKNKSTAGLETDKSSSNSAVQNLPSSEKFIKTPRRLLYEQNGNLFIKDGLDLNLKHCVWGIETKRQNIFISRDHLKFRLNFADDKQISDYLDNLKFNNVPVSQATFTSAELYLDTDFDDTISILMTHGVNAYNCIGFGDWLRYSLFEDFQRMYRNYNYAIGDCRKAIQIPEK